MSGEPRRSDRITNKHDYAKLNRAGQEGVEKGKGSPRGTTEEIEIIQEGKKQEEKEKVSLIDRLVDGDLLDKDYWDKIRTEHEEECKSKENDKILVEQQCYLMEQRKRYIENERHIKLLKMKVKKLDEEEVLAEKYFNEQMTWYQKKNSKVEEWFRRNNKVVENKKNDRSKSRNRNKNKLSRKKTQRRKRK